MIIAAVTVAGLVLSGATSYAADGDPTVVVADRPGAPGEMLHQLEKVTGRPLGTLDKVMAVDSGGVRLTGKEVEALAAGSDVAGVKVLGVMPGSKDILDTTMTDLSDGAYDGPRGSEAFGSALIFASYVPEGREWCLTMCISTGRSVVECILLSRR
ncbi:MAG TPA: hypothetical protein DGG94_05970 [Micromonosporaceae bacterium]|nr:hypothetical protein [Micromonosporaceae bacterium]HCU49342.1 hypothetical protein [Micromonosporaceae bacterium]